MAIKFGSYFLEVRRWQIFIHDQCQTHHESKKPRTSNFEREIKLFKFMCDIYFSGLFFRIAFL